VRVVNGRHVFNIQEIYPHHDGCFGIVVVR